MVGGSGCAPIAFFPAPPPLLRALARVSLKACAQQAAALLMMAEQVATLGLAAAALFWSHVETLERRLAA